jgi:hypothetical protein
MCIKYLYCNMLVPILGLIFHIVATYIKALVMSGDQFLYAFVEKSHRKPCQQVQHNFFSLLVILQPPGGQNNVRLNKKSPDDGQEQARNMLRY